MEFINRLEALIEVGGADAASEARDLLREVTGCSRAAVETGDALLVDLMTLGFLVEAGFDTFQNSARRLARSRLARLKLLLS